MSTRTRETLAGLTLAVLAFGLVWWGLSRTVDVWTAHDCSQGVSAACAVMGGN